ncbi:hypothetical protein [Cupriavidus sp. 2SB]|uniref:hypothetical protein n=1 Tax=Cupriavidus sp. 2SB TaxID=2502199 RepID=UPI0010F921E2|nr:hypothetical protein [Cupriavidus sp. 2SB]
MVKFNIATGEPSRESETLLTHEETGMDRLDDRIGAISIIGIKSVCWKNFRTVFKFQSENKSERTPLRKRERSHGGH